MPNGLPALVSPNGKLTLAGATALLAAGVLTQRKKRRVSKKKKTR